MTCSALTRSWHNSYRPGFEVWNETLLPHLHKNFEILVSPMISIETTWSKVKENCYWIKNFWVIGFQLIIWKQKGFQFIEIWVLMICFFLFQSSKAWLKRRLLQVKFFEIVIGILSIFISKKLKTIQYLLVRISLKVFVFLPSYKFACWLLKHL